MAISSIDGEYSVYVGNLDPATSLSDMEDLLYELFLQAGPLEKVYIPFDKETGKHKGYGFVEFMHKESVQYTINLMNGICLLDRYLNVRTVTQRRSSLVVSPPSTAKSTTDGGQSSSRVVDDDNPFLSTSKPITRLSLVPESCEATSTTLPHQTSTISNSSMTNNDGNPFLTPARPITRLSLTPSSSEMTISSFSSEALPVNTTSQPPALFSVATSNDVNLLSPLNQSPSGSSVPASPSMFPLNGIPPPPLLPPPPSQFMSHALNPVGPPNPFLFDPRCVPPPPPQPPPSLPPPLLPPPIPLFSPPNVNGFALDFPAQPQPLLKSPTDNLESNMEFPSHEGDNRSWVPYEVMNGHDRLHQSRLNANDHPAWLKSETKEKLSKYHLETLEKSLINLRKSLTNHRQ